jgi:hypothetical protein
MMRRYLLKLNGAFTFRRTSSVTDVVGQRLASLVAEELTDDSSSLHNCE